MAIYGSNFAYGQSIYKDEGPGSQPPRHEIAMRKLDPLEKLKEDGIFIGNYEVSGHYLDICEDNGGVLLNELFSDTANLLLPYYETTYDLVVDPADSVTIRQNRIVAAMRARGGLSKAYFEGLGNALGDGEYTVSIAEGSGSIGFIVATYSIYTSPQGPATIIPGLVTSGPFDESHYMITVTVTGVASAPELEIMYERLKPAWTEFQYTYVP
jgi:uncharacterized protein YmfQ (DUF2313 family)